MEGLIFGILRYNDWIFRKPSKLKILGLFSIVHITMVTMVTTQISPLT